MLRAFTIRSLVVVATATQAGCFVSFSGYSALDEATGGAGGTSSGGTSSGTGGAGKGGASGTSGASGTAGTGGIAGVGGNGGSSAGSGGTGGASGKGGGNAGTGAASGAGGAGAGGVGGAGMGGAGMGGAGMGGAGASGASGAGGAGAGGMGGAGMGGAGMGGAGMGGAGAGGGTAGCTGLNGPTMVQVPSPSGGTYCIDSTEVTNAQYSQFLKTGPTTNVSAACAFNTVFAPESNMTSCPEPLPYDPTGAPNYPVTCVDWCDAAAYCAWAGKRLCGSFAGGGVSKMQANAPGVDQWYAACSHTGAQTYPYPGGYAGQTCNGLDFQGANKAYPVMQFDKCQGGYAGIFDMSGNVAEWEDQCTGSSGATDECGQRGGHWLSLMDEMTCAASAYAIRAVHDNSIGFRCCKD
jgi:hypothetical protein